MELTYFIASFTSLTTSTCNLGVSALIILQFGPDLSITHSSKPEEEVKYVAVTNIQVDIVVCRWRYEEVQEGAASILVRTRARRYHEQYRSGVIRREVNSGWQGQVISNEKQTGHKRLRSEVQLYLSGFGHRHRTWATRMELAVKKALQKPGCQIHLEVPCIRFGSLNIISSHKASVSFYLWKGEDSSRECEE